VRTSTRCATSALALAVALLPAACAHRMPAPEVRADMVEVPAGSFVMGQDASDGQVGVDVTVDSMPRHEVYLKRFWIDRTEATVADYQRYLAATGAGAFPEHAYGTATPPGDLPIIAVDFAEAAAYCRWRGKRLPTEAEWEKAARGTDGRHFPWGNDWDPDRVAFRDHVRTGPDPVGSHPGNVSPYGALDMAGNAMEWTDSWYDAYPGSTLKRVAFGRMYRVLRGGSWESHRYQVRSANRFAVLPEIGQPSFGVRCVVSG
jgi:formylglycine-generating enzyme required for sulfatase activity